EGGAYILPSFAHDLSDEAAREVERKGVTLLRGILVKDCEPGLARLSDDSQIKSHTLVWAAGVKPNPLAELPDVPRSKSGRIQVDDYLRIKGREREYAIGDIASVV